MRIASFYPNFFHVAGIAYCALSIIETMQSDELQASLMGITSSKDLKKTFYKNAIPAYISSIVYKLFSEKQIKKIAEFRFAYMLDGSEMLYLWPTVPLSLYRKLHNQGHRLIVECVNTHQATSKAILDIEYIRLGISVAHGITLEDVTEETEKLKLADFVYSCSPQVRHSLINANVPTEKILDTSYGLRESDILSLEELKARDGHKEITVIFVGSIGVRKGAHLLLDYWCRANIKGKLKLVGHIEPEVAQMIEPYFQRSDIEHIPFVNDLTSIYKSADMFVLPSLEEGSPLVTYLALGAGLPSIVSPMGGGGVIKHGENGLIVNPHDDKGWIEALQNLFNDAALRKTFANKAHEKARSYLWSEVGCKRTKILLSRLNGRHD